MLKDRLSKTSGWQFHKWLFGPETFSRDFRETGLWSQLCGFMAQLVKHCTRIADLMDSNPVGTISAG